MKKTLILIDVYACCKCDINKRLNIKCITSTKRDDPENGDPVGKPALLHKCPRTGEEAVWTYFQTVRETVRV